MVQRSTMRQMLDRGHAQVKQFSGLAAEPLVSMDERMEIQFGRAILASLAKDAQARGYLADCSQSQCCPRCARG